MTACKKQPEPTVDTSEVVEAATEYPKLFNGKDLTGWRSMIRDEMDPLADQVLQALDGVLHLFKDFPEGYGNDVKGNPTHGMLFTEQSYSHYMLRFEYKWGTKLVNNYDRWQYDSGVYYHVVEEKLWPRGLEFQIRYNHEKDQNHTGDFWGSGVSFNWSTGALKRYVPVSAGGEVVRKSQECLALEPETVHALNDEWNLCEVVVMGSDYAIHAVNGQIVNVATDLSVGQGRLEFSPKLQRYYSGILKLSSSTKRSLSRLSCNKSTLKRFAN
ncbi:Unannotated [Lentimonas sp. CC4]|nr:Unannotated [Lentimonas sp. CC4]